MKNEFEITRTISPIHHPVRAFLAVAAISGSMILGAGMAFADTIHPVGTSQQASQGGFYGPGPALVTVQQAMGMRDDTPVTLKGHIVQSLGDEEYLFKDATGTIRVEIDHKLWAGIQVSPDELVEIQGEIEKEWNKTEVDVARIIKIK
ncbi:YgiW/YdeI family stress tolerance OB fold protein [Oxalobacter vibrioformis]|uniref:YgiW/YdeI family stress tolerance OB fold protein n=1 Tax=Oxalobacter vibrioformis TaxID=933080 RepID=A0A9E9P3S2_9BURK|nr:NirD/YgiW/YdeI family stress tolerance protein [Oxalobacter vibrioformis]WAW09421.1 YgiW/YdeI family stress tolerance OB fold protein [Oxalobacter vibrioformis]